MWQLLGSNSVNACSRGLAYLRCTVLFCDNGPSLQSRSPGESLDKFLAPVSPSHSQRLADDRTVPNRRHIFARLRTDVRNQT